MIKTVGIIGLGALGIMYGKLFGDALGKDQVQIIADAERVERYRREGVLANGERCDFQYIDAKQAKPVDLLIFATKYLGLERAIDEAAGACGPDTIVMSFLNGVISEQMIAEKLAPRHLLYCTVQGMDATKEGNALRYQRVGSVTFGEKDNRRSETVAQAAELFDRVGLAYQIPEDIMHALWSKWMLNVGVNQVCAVYGCGYAGVQEPGERREAMIAAMEEARKTANAEGISLTEQELWDWVVLMDTLSPDGEPSMRQDTKAGRKTEVELFAGTVCRLGKQHAIPTPWNDRLYDALK